MVGDRVRTMGDQLGEAIGDHIWEWLIEKLEYGGWRFGDEDHRPVLLEDEDPDVYPLFVDIADERYLIDVDVTVHRIDKGGSSDWSKQYG